LHSIRCEVWCCLSLSFLLCTLLSLFLLAPPNPPTGVEIVPFTGDHTQTVTVYWSPPTTETVDAPVSGYMVQATPLPTAYGSAVLESSAVLENSGCVEVECEVVEEVVGGRGSGSVTLKPLLPGLIYNVTVSSLSHGLRLQSMPNGIRHETSDGGTHGGCGLVSRVFISVGLWTTEVAL